MKLRASGVLLHPTSLPSGCLDEDAIRFIDFLQQGAFGYWQMLPLGPNQGDLSPYSSSSAFALNTALFKSSFACQQAESAVADDDPDYLLFREAQHDWLPDYCLFTAIKNAHDQVHWNLWPEPLRSRDPNALQQFVDDHCREIAEIEKQQFICARQWQEIKRYANQKNIRLIGDMPFFVAHDSADVWANQRLFKLDQAGNTTCVAGVPPDYFSETGQRWGNPVYQWSQHQKEDFNWWLSRLTNALSQFDLIRIDHFRGFEACWEIPAEDEVATNGCWVSSPGEALFTKLAENISPLPLIAEDLGLITPAVSRLRCDFKLPGMKILQFAFDSDADNPYLPHNHSPDCVVYTGTHDNNTTVGWFEGLDQRQKDRVLDYYAWPGEPMPWPLIKSTLASVSNLAIIPLQDLLSLDGQHRMNTPGTTNNNWTWKFSWSQIDPQFADRLAVLNHQYKRAIL